jgi:hypothetical protein
MTSAYRQQLAQLARRASRYRAAWHNARYRAVVFSDALDKTIATAQQGCNVLAGMALDLVARAEQAEARIAALTPCIERVLDATGCMVEHWADANSTGNTEWRSDMWSELHRSADALGTTLAGEPVPVNVPDGACGAYAPRYGAVCGRPKDHPEAYHRDAKERVYWLTDAIAASPDGEAPVRATRSDRCGPACSEAHTYDGCCQQGPDAGADCPLPPSICEQRKCTTAVARMLEAK